jgi:hypothetical protein
MDAFDLDFISAHGVEGPPPLHNQTKTRDRVQSARLQERRLPSLHITYTSSFAKLYSSNFLKYSTLSFRSLAIFYNVQVKV